MPKVGGRKFGYGAAGMKAAKKYAKKTGRAMQTGAVRKKKASGKGMTPAERAAKARSNMKRTGMARKMATRVKNARAKDLRIKAARRR